MALEIMRDDVRIIQGLSDYPNQEEGLSSGQMKAKFDEAAVMLQSFINGSIVPAVNDKLSASELSGAVADTVEQTLGSITPDKIGAAPAGYGLGGAPVSAPNDNLDEATENGWYSCSGTTIGRPTGLNYIEYGTVLVIRRYGQNVTQLYVSQPNTSMGAPYLLVRNCSSYNAWNPWEWINPPMLAGGEYRTVKRWNGKPVYVKAVNVGSLPNNSSKTIAHGISGNTGFVSVRVCATSGSNGFDLVNGSGNFVSVIGQNIQISTNVDASSYTGTAIIEYTKT